MKKLVRNEFVVGCTQEEAFDFLSDLRNEPEWNPDMCQSVEKVTDGPVGRGTRYRAKWKNSPQIEVDYVHFDRPHTWRAHSDGLLESNFQCMIEPHADGAKVVTELELIPHGFFKLFFPIFKLVFSKSEKAAADRIRRTLHERFGDSKAAA
jgi:hypothetical protein